MEFEVLAEGLQFPEGPIAMDDGSVILVEIARGTLTRVWNGKTEVIAHLGGGPNGAALGPDGAIYVCNNGGFRWHIRDGLRIPGNAADDYTTGRIERVDLNTGKIERLYDNFEGERLSGPNDLVFDKNGGFWFTDLGKRFKRSRDHSGLYYAKPDGSYLHKAIYPAVSFNGVGLSPDESTVYCNDTDLGKVFFAKIESPGKLAKFGTNGWRANIFGELPGYQMLDSLAVEANGNVCSATLFNGGITVFMPEGKYEHIPFPDPLVTNVCFGGEDMRDAFITLSATGRLIKARWPRPGLRLNFAR
jgi:gluconolactonase